jgi:hypothetical protein
MQYRRRIGPPTMRSVLVWSVALKEPTKLATGRFLRLSHIPLRCNCAILPRLVLFLYDRRELCLCGG